MSIALRPEYPSDEPFLRNLTIETIASELGASAWPEPMRSHLLSLQYVARRQSHRSIFPEIQSHVIDLEGNGKARVAAGWLVVSPMPQERRIVDIMVLEAFRGKGIGTAAIREVISAAVSERKPVRLHVSVTNHNAIRLYERLGFRKIDPEITNAVHCFMERAATPESSRRAFPDPDEHNAR